MSNEQLIFVIDSNHILGEIATLTVTLSGQAYSIFVNPNQDTESYIKLSCLSIENTSHIHMLIFANDNISLLDNDEFRNIFITIIKDDAYQSFLYATLYLKDRFTEGEAAMESDKEIWVAYCHMLNNSFRPTTYSGKRVY